MDSLFYLCVLIGVLGFIALFIPTDSKNKKNKHGHQH